MEWTDLCWRALDENAAIPLKIFAYSSQLPFEKFHDWLTKNGMWKKMPKDYRFGQWSDWFYVRALPLLNLISGADLGFSRGGGSIFKKKFENFTTFFLGRPNWFSELS